MDSNSIHRISERGRTFFPATPLWYAYTRGRNETLFKWLLKNGANPDNCMFAIAWYDDPQSASLFKKHGARITDLKGRNTPFLAAVDWRKYDMMKWFLENGADVNYADEKGNTALFYAVKRKFDISHIRLLLKYGADFNKANRDGVSAKKQAEMTGPKSVLALFS